jgi:hypothetical protein
MATDRRLGPETKASSPPASTETGRLVRELVEALTAVGNYLAAANRILAGETMPAAEPLDDVLDKSTGPARLGHRDRSRLEAAERALAITEAIQIEGHEPSEIPVSPRVTQVTRSPSIWQVTQVPNARSMSRTRWGG